MAHKVGQIIARADQRGSSGAATNKRRSVTTTSERSTVLCGEAQVHQCRNSVAWSTSPCHEHHSRSSYEHELQKGPRQQRFDSPSGNTKLLSGRMNVCRENGEQ